MKRQRYTAEFKQEAVKLILIDGTPVKEVSQQLGLPYNWKLKHLEELKKSGSLTIDVTGAIAYKF